MASCFNRQGLATDDLGKGVNRGKRSAKGLRQGIDKTITRTGNSSLVDLLGL